MALKPWSLPSVVANTVTDLVSPTAGKEVVILGMIITNTSAADEADVTVSLTSNSGVLKAPVFKGRVDPGDSIHIDTKICLAASATPDKLRVLSSVGSVSFLASGDEG